MERVDLGFRQAKQKVEDKQQIRNRQHPSKKKLLQRVLWEFYDILRLFLGVLIGLSFAVVFAWIVLKLLL